MSQPYAIFEINLNFAESATLVKVARTFSPARPERLFRFDIYTQVAYSKQLSKAFHYCSFSSHRYSSVKAGERSCQVRGDASRDLAGGRLPAITFLKKWLILAIDPAESRYT